MAGTMNRIYQGRVTKVEVLKRPSRGEQAGPLKARKATEPKWEEMKNGEAALWRHHELFQDAVNGSN